MDSSQFQVLIKVLKSGVVLNFVKIVDQFTKQEQTNFINSKNYNEFRADLENAYYEARDFFREVLHREPKIVKRINDNINYWYPEKLYDYFCKVWTNFHELKNKKNKISVNAVALALF